MTVCFACVSFPSVRRVAMITKLAFCKTVPGPVCPGSCVVLLGGPLGVLLLAVQFATHHSPKHAPAFAPGRAAGGVGSAAVCHRIRSHVIACVPLCIVLNLVFFTCFDFISNTNDRNERHTRSLIHTHAPTLTHTHTLTRTLPCSHAPKLALVITIAVQLIAG